MFLIRRLYLSISESMDVILNTFWNLDETPLKIEGATVSLLENKSTPTSFPLRAFATIVIGTLNLMVSFPYSGSDLRR